MMVGDHDTQTRGLGAADGVDSGNATVARHDQCGIDALRLGQPGRTEVVPVHHAMRQERVRVGTGGPERARQHGGRALAIHVVVAVHQNALAGTHGRHDHGHRLRHSSETVRIGQGFELGAEEGLDGGWLTETALHEQCGKWQRQLERRSEGARLGAIRRRGDAPPWAACQTTAAAT